MKRAHRQRLGLLAGVIILLLIAAWQMHRDNQNAPGHLLTLDPAQISHIDLQVGQQKAEHYVKRDGQWLSVDGDTSRPADTMRLRELMGIAAAPVQTWQPASTFELGKIGLAPAQATLTLDGQTLKFGGMAAVGHTGYVQVDDRVALVSLVYMPRAASSQTVRPQ